MSRQVGYGTAERKLQASERVTLVEQGEQSAYSQVDLAPIVCLVHYLCLLKVSLEVLVCPTGSAHLECCMLLIERHVRARSDWLMHTKEKVTPEMFGRDVEPTVTR